MRPYPWGPYYYPYAPVYVAPAPVVVERAPVVQPAPVPVPTYSSPAPLQLQTPPTEIQGASANLNSQLRLLADANEQVRTDTVLQLGRMRATEAVDPLAATLAGDRSPFVREAAARALGLIGSSKALPALQRAAQVDADRDVRHSAQFAMEVIQARN